MEGKYWDLNVMVFMSLILIGFRSSRGRRMKGKVMIYMEYDKEVQVYAYFQ